MRKYVLLAVLPLSLLLGSCLGDVMEVFCEGGGTFGGGEGDSDHCYQATAVQKSDPEDCAKIEFPPPRSKCHLMIAENTGNPSVCEGVEGGMMGYSEEECLEKAFNGHSVEDCKNAADEVACRTAWSKHKKTCGTDYQYDNETAKCKKIEGSDDGIDDKGLEDVKTMAEAGKGKYMELLEQAIENENDPAKLAGLEAYKKFLEEAGEKLETVQTNLETLEELKKIFIDSYDPSMDIERMPVDKILGKGLFERIKDKMFGGGDEPTGQEAESAKAEEALEVYAKMLERQEDVDFLKKGKGERLKDTIISKLKDEATDKLKESVTEIAEKAGGTAFAAVGFVGDALKSFQDEAQKQTFIGLARAYNRRRDALEQQFPGMDPAELHNRVVQQVIEDPYRDNTNLGVIKHGNILENKNCADESNPLCIDPHVWWTAMDKTYQYQQKAKK